MSRYPAGRYRSPTPDETEQPHLHPPVLLALLEVAAVLWVGVSLALAASLRMRSGSLDPWDTALLVIFGVLLPIACAWAIETNKPVSRWLVLVWLAGSFFSCWLLLERYGASPALRWGSAFIHGLLFVLAAREMLFRASGRNFYRQLAGYQATAAPTEPASPSWRVLQRLGRVSEIVSELALVALALFVAVYVVLRTLGAPV